MADAPNLVPLLAFFVGVALCLWRVPQADRWHLVLCLVAAGLWCGALMFLPAAQRLGFGLVTASFLITALSRAFRRRAAEGAHHPSA